MKGAVLQGPSHNPHAHTFSLSASLSRARLLACLFFGEKTTTGLLVEGGTEYRSAWHIPPGAEMEVIRVSFTAETSGEFKVLRHFYLVPLLFLLFQLPLAKYLYFTTYWFCSVCMYLNLYFPNDCGLLVFHAWERSPGKGERKSSHPLRYAHLTRCLICAALA